MNIQEIHLLKETNGDESKRHLYFRNGEHSEDIELNEDSYKSIFENIRPNNSFSTPDTMIQGFLQNTKTMPSFLNNHLFTNHEFKKILEPIKLEMNHVVELNSDCNMKKRKKYFKNNRTKKQKRSKQQRLRKIYKKKNNKTKSNPKTKPKSKPKTN